MHYRLMILLVFFLQYSCAPSRFVKPLDKKQQAVNVSLGGALFEYSNLTIPFPLLSATYGYGCDSSLTAFGGVHLTSALYGNVQLEAGATKRLVKQHGLQPAISITPEVNLLYHPKESVRLFPQLDVNAYWDHNKQRNFFYIGLSNWFELAQTKAFNQKQPDHWFLSPQAGETFVRKKGSFTIEAKWIAPNIYNPGSVVIYKTPVQHHGAAAIYFSYTRKF